MAADEAGAAGTSTSSLPARSFAIEVASAAAWESEEKVLMTTRNEGIGSEDFQWGDRDCMRRTADRATHRRAGPHRRLPRDRRERVEPVGDEALDAEALLGGTARRGAELARQPGVGEQARIASTSRSSRVSIEAVLAVADHA
jgi:hypothetical protein